MAVVSKYGGKCPRCTHRYRICTIIEKSGLQWIPVDCPGCVRQQEDLAHINELQSRMLLNYNIAYGCWGIPEDTKPTFSPYEFIMEAEKLNEATSEERDAFFSFYGSSIHMDLSD